MPRLPLRSCGSLTFLDPNPGKVIDHSLETHPYTSTYTQHVPVTAEGI